jgi:hypothetical protein
MKKVSAFILIDLILAFSQANACTAFAANGADFVTGSGTLIAKVRDQMMTGQVVKTVYPTSGHAYMGLFNGRKEFFNMGINEKGFVAFATTAGSIPKTERLQVKTFRSSEGLTGLEYMMRNCGSVQEALSHVEIFQHRPANYFMADAKQIAFVEVLPNRTFKTVVKDNGMLTHTNHYITEEARQYNKKISASSQTRLERIQTLLEGHQKPLTLDDFIRFTEDRNDGLDCSIFRLGSKDSVPTTLSTMVVHIPEKGTPKLYLKWRDKRNDKNSWQMLETDVHFTKETTLK